MGFDQDDEPTRRQVARRARRDAGDASAKLANTLMALPPSALVKLGLDSDLLAVLTRARAVKALIARRRAERTVAGALRRVDLEALEAKIESVRSTGVADTQRLHQTERWRTRLLDDVDGVTAFRAAFPAAADQPIEAMVADARSERTTGKPRGAGRALFRRLGDVLAVASDAATAALAAAAIDDD